MNGLWGSFIFRRLWREPLRALTTLCGIALGIAVIIGIDLAKTSSVDGFRQGIDLVAGRAALEISAPGGLPEARIPELLWLREFGVPCPVVEGEAVFGEPPHGEILHVLGVDVLRDQEVRDYEIAALAGGRSRPTPAEFLALLMDPHAVILTEKFARRRGLKAGDAVDLHFADQRLPMRISALLLDRGAARVLDGSVVLMDIAAAQWRLGKLGRLDRVELKLRRGLDVAATESAIAARLPPGLEVRRPSRRGAEVEKMLSAYHFNLTLLSGIAFLAGLYVIYNAVSLSVISRREEIGMLRTLGVSRWAILRLFLGEAAAFAIPGCLLGLLLGQWLARWTVAFTETTNRTLYTQTQVALGSLDWKVAVPVVILGSLLALLAAWRPAWEASRLSPMEAVRSVPDAAEPRRAWKAGVLAAVASLGVAVGCCFVPAIGGLPLGGTVACLCAAAAAGFAMQAILTLTLRLLRPLMHGRLGAEGQLAWSGLAGGRKRLAIPVGALGGTLALSVAIAVMVGSFRQTLIYWVENSLAADLFLRPATKRNVGVESALSPETMQVLAANPSVAEIERMRTGDISYQDSRIVLSVTSFRILAERGRVAFKSAPGDWRTMLREAPSRDEVLVTEAFSLRYHKGVGDRIELPTPQGSRAFTVCGIFFDYTNDRGVVTMDHSTWEKHFGPFVPTNVALYLKPGADPDKIRAELLGAFPPGTSVQIYTNATLRREVLRIFDSTFSITWALEAIAILVAMAGVATTIFTLVLERRGELNILRQLGAARAQLRRELAVEAGYLGLLSQAVGLVLGFGISLILVYVINVQTFGWTIRFKPPWLLLLQFTLVLPVLTALAGWLFSAGILRLAGRRRTITEIRE